MHMINTNFLPVGSSKSEIWIAQIYWKLCINIITSTEIFRL